MPLKVALVGAGHMGRIHLQKLMSLKEVQVVGVADTDKKAAEGVSGKYGIPFFTDYGEFPKDLNGVVIASPTETHFEIAESFLKDGTHVFIEKPIASTTEQAHELVKLANQRNLILQVGHLERFNPAYRSVLPHIKSPLFIETRRTSNFTGRSTDIDVVLDLMIHDIDLVLSIEKKETKHIHSQGVALVADKFDMVNTTVEFSNGCTASLFASRISTKKERSLSIFEKDRHIFVDLLTGKSTCNIKNEDGVIETVEYASENVDSVMDELSEFICSIKGEKTPCVRGEDGLKALMLANRIKEQIAQ
jgi:predicted dehydrogenase